VRLRSKAFIIFSLKELIFASDVRSLPGGILSGESEHLTKRGALSAKSAFSHVWRRKISSLAQNNCGDGRGNKESPSHDH